MTLADRAPRSMRSPLNRQHLAGDDLLVTNQAAQRIGRRAIRSDQPAAGNSHAVTEAGHGIG
jgi:hypothetical protein